MEKDLDLYFLLVRYQAAEGARIAGASRIIGIDLNESRADEGKSLHDRLLCVKRVD